MLYYKTSGRKSRPRLSALPWFRSDAVPIGLMKMSLGSTLRLAREARGLTVERLADTLCLSIRYVQAMECDDVQAVPGVFFYRAFVQQYARAVGLDFSKLKLQLDQVCAPFMGTEDAVQAPPVVESPFQLFREKCLAWMATLQKEPVASDDSPIRVKDPIVRESNRYYRRDQRFGASAAIFATALICCSAFYSWYTKPPAVASSEPPTPSPVAVTVKTDEQPITLPKSAIEAVANGDQQPVEPEQVQHVTLSLEAKEKTWLSVTSGDKVIFSGILEPSQTKKLAGIETGQIRVGNAGGVEMKWKGRPIGPLGPSGQPRTVILKKDDNVEILGPGRQSPEI